MSNKAKLYTVASLVGVFVLLSTLSLMTLIKDRQELRHQLSDLEVINYQTEEHVKSLNSSNAQLQDEVWQYKDSLEKMNEELHSLRISIEETKSDNTKLQADVKKLQQTNRDLSGSNKYLLDKVESMKKDKVSQYKAPAKTSPAKGSVETPKTTVSRSSRATSTEIYMSATAYTAYCNGCSGVTRTGIDLRANPNLKVIAVDPSVIPLGTKVYVEGYGYAVAGDTGGAIKGHKIDLFIASQQQALKWGRKKVKVTILK